MCSVVYFVLLSFVLVMRIMLICIAYNKGSTLVQASLVVPVLSQKEDEFVVCYRKQVIVFGNY